VAVVIAEVEAEAATVVAAAMTGAIVKIVTTVAVVEEGEADTAVGHPLRTTVEVAAAGETTDLDQDLIHHVVKSIITKKTVMTINTSRTLYNNLHPFLSQPQTQFRIQSCLKAMYTYIRCGVLYEFF